MLLPRHEMIRMTTYLEAVRPFREAFVYSQWNWLLIQEVVVTATGKTLDAVIKERITGPLGMKRTALQWIEVQGGDNIAAAHAVGNDATPNRILFPNLSDPTGHAAGAGGKSTIRDLLTVYRSLLRAYTDQTSRGTTSTPGNPFCQLETIFSPQIAVNSAAPIGKTAYCLGVYRTRVPGNLSVASMNTILLEVPKTFHKSAHLGRARKSSTTRGPSLASSPPTFLFLRAKALSLFSPTLFR